MGNIVASAEPELNDNNTSADGQADPEDTQFLVQMLDGFLADGASFPEEEALGRVVEALNSDVIEVRTVAMTLLEKMVRPISERLEDDERLMAVYAKHASVIMPAVLRVLATTNNNNVAGGGDDLLVSALLVAKSLARPEENAKSMFSDHPGLLRLVVGMFSPVNLCDEQVEEEDDDDDDDGEEEEEDDGDDKLWQGTASSSIALRIVLALAKPAANRFVMHRDIPFLYPALGSLLRGVRINQQPPNKQETSLVLAVMAALTHDASVSENPALVTALLELLEFVNSDLPRRRRRAIDKRITCYCLQNLANLATNPANRDDMLQDPALVPTILAQLLPHVDGSSLDEDSIDETKITLPMMMTSAVACLASLMQDSAFPLDQTMQHCDCLLPLLCESMEAGPNSNFELRAACTRLVYELSHRVSLGDLLDSSGAFPIGALQQNAFCMEEAADRFLALFTLMDVSDARRGEGNGAEEAPTNILKYDEELVGTVHWALAREFTELGENILIPALRALHSLVHRESCAKMLWDRYGVDGGVICVADTDFKDVAIKPLLPLLLDVWEQGLQWSNDEVVEHAILIIMRLAAVSCTTAALCQAMPRINGLLAQEEAIDTPKSNRAGKLLLRRLAKVKGAVAPTAAAPPPPRLIRRDMVRLFGQHKTDECITAAAKL